MKGSFLLAALLIAGTLAPLHVEAGDGRPQNRFLCSEATRDVCDVVCGIERSLPFGVLKAVLDCLP